MHAAEREQVCDPAPMEACLRGGSIHQRFEAQVKRTPNATAVIFERKRLTYRELNRRANQLAHYPRTLRVGPEVLVGICMERSMEMVVGLLGILKAGGAYVPLDPAYPKGRLAFMLEDAQVPVLLTQGRLVEGLTEHRARTVCFDTAWEVIAQENEQNPTSDATEENLAYVIYTSGSTGGPKGVMITHKAVLNTLDWLQGTFTLDSSDVIAQKTSASFTDSVWEFFWPLIVGAKFTIINDDSIRNPNFYMNI